MSDPRYAWLEKVADELAERPIKTEREGMAYADAQALVLKRMKERIAWEKCNPQMISRATRVSGASALGHAIGVGAPLALMAWASAQVESTILRVALIVWVVFAVGLQVAVAGGWKPSTSPEAQ